MSADQTASPDLESLRAEITRSKQNLSLRGFLFADNPTADNYMHLDEAMNAHHQLFLDAPPEIQASWEEITDSSPF